MLPRSNAHLSRKKFFRADATLPTTTCKKCSKTNNVECICHKLNILIRPPNYEETCFIFDQTESMYNITSTKLLSMKKLVTEIIYPFDNTYDFYRLNYNHLFNFYPVAIVRVHKTSDVVNTIKFCRQTGLPLRLRGGAHAYEPASLVNFGIVIDLSPRNQITNIDCADRTVTIQSGALLGPIVNELSKKNMLIPFGTCVTNGLAGLTLGGGIGFATRAYGLTLDAVVDIEVVLADSHLTHANKTHNKDLYWALRGAGGGNYGAITNFTFKFDVIEYVTVFTINYKFEDTKKVFDVWQRWAPYTINKLTSELDIFNRFQPVIVTGQMLPIKNSVKDQKKLFKLIKPLLDLDLQTNISIKTMSLQEAAQYFGQGSYARPLFFYNKSYFNFRFLSSEAIDTIIHFMGLLDQTQSHHKTEVDALGGYFGSVDSRSTAFPARDAIHWFQFTSLWDVTEEEKENKAWMDAYYAAMSKFFPEHRRYVNALDYSIPRAEALESYYGKNLPRLIKIKNKYDKTDFFRFEQSIPTTPSII